jgi:hypothetical protein
MHNGKAEQKTFDNKQSPWVWFKIDVLATSIQMLMMA